jgi:hypothetical protein
LKFCPVFVRLRAQTRANLRNSAKLNRSAAIELTAMISTNSFRVLEARVGIEPTHKGFADLSLTTWVPRPELNAHLLALRA